MHSILIQRAQLLCASPVPLTAQQPKLRANTYGHCLAVTSWSRDLFLAQPPIAIKPRSPPICLQFFLFCTCLGLQLAGIDLQGNAGICSTTTLPDPGSFPHHRQWRTFLSSNVCTASQRSRVYNCGPEELWIYSSFGASKAHQGHIYLLSLKMSSQTLGGFISYFLNTPPTMHGL